MRKRQAKPNTARVKLVEKIGTTVRAIMDGGSTPDLEVTLTALRAEDDKADGMAYADAMVMINRAMGVEQTGSGEYRLW